MWPIGQPWKRSELFFIKQNSELLSAFFYPRSTPPVSLFPSIYNKKSSGHVANWTAVETLRTFFLSSKTASYSLSYIIFLFFLKFIFYIMTKLLDFWTERL
jgi:hypothetical protein